MVPYRRAAARAERQVLAHAVVLHQQRRQRIAHRVGLDGRVAHGQPADPARRRHVALQQPRSHGQDVGVVVEAVGEIVGRQHRPGIDLQVEQIADGVRVLQTVQAMDGRPARVRLCGGGPVEGGLQPRRERAVGRGVRPRAARRRHRLRAQLLEDLLPDLRVHPNVLDVDAVQGEVPRQQTLVVAGDAVAVQYGPPSRGVGRGWRLTRSLLHNRRHGCGDRSGSLSCRGRGAQDERQESSDSWSRHGSRPGSPRPTRHRRLPRRRAVHPTPHRCGRRPGNRRLAFPLLAQPTLSGRLRRSTEQTPGECPLATTESAPR